VINNLTFDIATKDPMQQAIRDARLVSRPKPRRLPESTADRSVAAPAELVTILAFIPD
jgi:hypothetical protein